MEEEECSLEEIARRLNEKGYPPPRRPTTRKQSRRERQISGWTASAVRYILQNPLYVGDLIWGKFRKDEDPVPHTEADLNCEGAVLHRDFMPDPPVTRERFENVQRILERQRQKRRSGKQEVPYVLSGLITCVHCGAGWYGFTSTRAERTRRRYYRHEQGNRTSASRGETLCPHRNRYVRASEIERLVLHQALTAAQSDSLEARIRDEIRSRLKMLRSTDHAARAQRLETQLARHEEEVARVILEKARTTDATLLKGYDRVLEELSRGVRETELRLSELKEEHRNAERALDCYAESLSQARDLLSVFEVAPLSQKRAVLKELIEAIRFDPEQCRAEVRILLPAP